MGGGIRKISPRNLYKTLLSGNAHSHLRLRATSFSVKGEQSIMKTFILALALCVLLSSVSTGRGAESPESSLDLTVRSIGLPADQEKRWAALAIPAAKWAIKWGIRRYWNRRQGRR